MSTSLLRVLQVMFCCGGGCAFKTGG